MSTTEAKEAIAAEQQARVKATAEAIEAALKSNRCRLQPVVVVTDGKIEQHLNIVPEN